MMSGRRDRGREGEQDEFGLLGHSGGLAGDVVAEKGRAWVSPSCLVLPIFGNVMMVYDYSTKSEPV